MSDSAKIDLFKPEQPHIPGVSVAPPEQTAEAQDQTVLATRKPGRIARLIPRLLPFAWVFLTIGGMAVTGAGLLWWSRKPVSDAPPAAAPVVVMDLPSAKAVTPKPPLEAGPVAPGTIGKIKELAKPWSAKHFLFRDVVSSELVPAVVVRLPGGDLWGVALREPYGSCELEYVDDLQKLKTTYHFAASHPMIANTCTGTIFDLAVYGYGPNGLVRGEIVAGTAVRPPLAIKVETRGNELVATRME